MLIFILFLNLYLGQNINSCDVRTAIYQSHGSNNTNYFYFDSRTYFNNSTKIYNGTQFKSLIRRTIKDKCTGIWCVNNEWTCRRNFPKIDTDCYLVAHIIPRLNKINEISGCETSILSNLIMSYVRWDLWMSNQYYVERMKIYGKDIFLNAYKSIYRNCYGKNPIEYPIEFCM